MTIGRLTVGLLCACAASLAWARTGTVSVEKDGETFNVTFANHANETNGLWVVYGAADRGEGTNGWEQVSFLGTVTPATNSWQYVVPAGWGDSVKAIRFILSEVPYDYDYTLDFLRSGSTATTGWGNRRIHLHDFPFNTKYRVGLKMREAKYNGSGNLTLFSTRDPQGGGTPYYTLFWIGGANWRFDYNTVNDNSVAGAKEGDIYNIMADGRNGLWVNGEKLQKKGVSYTYLAQDVSGRLEFFCANQENHQKTDGGMSNSNGNMDLFGAQVYASADADAELLVNLVPMVKDGRAGMYDTVRDKYYYNDTVEKKNGVLVPVGDFKLDVGPSRIEGENPFFASALCKVKTEGPDVFAPATFMEDATAYTNEQGGVMVGEGALKLTGANDWGGAFTVSNGTLIAEFGRGLGPNDHLVLSDLGSYGGWNGVVTNSIGTGAGQIIATGTNPYLSFTAAEGDLHVNLGGKGDPWETTSALCRLRLNFCPVNGVVYFDNPIHGTSPMFILRNAVGESVLTHPYLESEEYLAGEKAFGVFGEEGVAPRGNTTTVAPTNSYANFVVNNGGWTFGPGSTNVIAGQLSVNDGIFTASNAVIVQTGVSTNLEPTSYFKGAPATFSGGSFKTGVMTIGEPWDGGRQMGSVVVDGEVTVAQIAYRNAAGKELKTTGTPVIRSNAASSALVLNEHADMVVQNFRFQRRNIIQNGGRLHLNGGQGILDMGRDGTSRYQALGGRVELPCFKRYAESDKDSQGVIAQVLLGGGTIAVTPNGKGGVLFRDFPGDPQGVVCVNALKGGTIETDYDVSVTNMIYRSSQLGKGFEDSWKYQTAQYLTAPALVKRGKGTLTLTETNAYICATEVAAGTLKLSGARAALPAGGVARVTGGTLDLGGNDQTLKALCGTAGTVKNGSVTVTEGIYPGGKDAIGSFTCDAALAGTLFIDVDATGAADSLVTSTALDLSNIDLVISAPATAPEVLRRLKIVNGPFAGSFRSVTGLPAGWTLRYGNGRVTIGPDHGTVLLFR